MDAVTIIVAGGVNIDTTYHVANLPREGETIFSTNTASSLGGKGLNQAVAAQRAGAHVAILGTVGADQAGTDIRGFAKREGIETSLLRQASGESTGSAIIAVDAAANNMIIVDSGANKLTNFSVEDVPLSDLPNASYVVANCEAPIAVITTLFEFAKRAGISTAWNPSPVPADSAPLLLLTDVLVLNETEATAIHSDGGPPEHLVQMIAKRGPREVVLTLGASGALVYADGVLERVPAEAARAVDPTAAGDTFLGYYIASRAKRQSPIDSARNAGAAAALCVQRQGAVNAIPKAEELVGGADV